MSRFRECFSILRLFRPRCSAQAYQAARKHLDDLDAAVLMKRRLEERHDRAEVKALEAFQLLSRTEGIIPALESSHAVAHAIEMAKTMDKDEIILINLSGRGDKDVDEVRRLLAAKAGEKQ